MFTPLEITQRQLDCYNAHDLDGFCACFSEDVEVELMIGNETLFKGGEALRQFYGERFSNEALHAKLISRMAVGQVVIDEEEVTGLPDVSKLSVIAIYEIYDGLIRKVRFVRAN